MASELYKDGMTFRPYPHMGGWQCIINHRKGEISVRYDCPSLFTDKDHPYEVWYPDQDTPIGYQTITDIMNYIRGE